MWIRKVRLLFLGLFQMILLLLLSACGGYIDTTQPPQSAIKTLVISQSLSTDSIRHVKIADYLNLPLSEADTANNITQRWCIALTYIYKDSSGQWQDGEVSWVLAEKGKFWVNDELMSVNISGLPYNENALTGSCDWVR